MISERIKFFQYLSVSMFVNTLADRFKVNMKHFIGREKELKRLIELKNSYKSEFVAVYGRRRVGKTMLIRQVFEKDFVFQATAIANVKKHFVL